MLNGVAMPGSIKTFHEILSAAGSLNLYQALGGGRETENN